MDLNVNEKLIYTLLNIIDQDNKFLIITSIKPISEINFKLDDLRSRTKNCLLAKIENPDDELMFALILKNLSDRQIKIDKKLIIGSSFFGIGWGLIGLCPGPAVSSIAIFEPLTFVFLIMMSIGVIVNKYIFSLTSDN